MLKTKISKTTSKEKKVNKLAKVNAVIDIKNENTTDLSGYLQVFPQGLAITGDELTSFVLFKDLEGKISFPVWCPALPFGVQSLNGEFTLRNPYDLALVIFDQLDFKLKNCTFDVVDHDEQMATLILESTSAETLIEPLGPETKGYSFSKPKILNQNKIKNLRLKAFEALAICGATKGIEFFATTQFIQKTRDVAVQEKNTPAQILKKNTFLKSRQKYIL